MGAGHCGEICGGRILRAEMCGERAWSREASVVAGLSLSETFVINVYVTCVYNIFCLPVCFHRSTMAVVGY
jgi:hypothetical protein